MLYHQSSTTTPFSLLQDESKESSEDGQAELDDDEVEITEQDGDGERETGEENTSHLDDGDDDGSDELTVDIRSQQGEVMTRFQTITYPRLKSRR